MFQTIRSSGYARAMLSVSTAMFVGDFTCQQIEQTSTANNTTKSPLSNPTDICYQLNKTREWNASRSVRMGVTGFVLSGPISQFTYNSVSRFLSNHSMFSKVLITCAVAPINISCSLMTPSFLAGRTTDQLYKKWSTEILPTFALNTIFWAPSLYIIMSRVKLANRGAVGSVFWFGWSIVLSVVANR